MLLLLKYLCSNCKKWRKISHAIFTLFFYPNLVAMTLKNFVVLILSISISIHFPKSFSNRYIWWNIITILDRYESLLISFFRNKNFILLMKWIHREIIQNLPSVLKIYEIYIRIFSFFHFLWLPQINREKIKSHKMKSKNYKYFRIPKIAPKYMTDTFYFRQN